jgi:hypothetical protein
MLIEKLAKTHNIRQVADCYAVDDRRLINVRHKSSPTLHRKTGKQEFGLPLRDYRRYLRSPVPFYLAVECASAVYIARIEELDRVKRVYDGNAVDQGGSVFLPVKAFKKITMKQS